jgi:hypothetical protein
MQAIALVTGDEFLLPYNLTIGLEDVLDYIDSLNYKWDTYDNDATFDDLYGIDFAYEIGSTGFCFNFNMVDADEIFQLNL